MELIFILKASHKSPQAVGFGVGLGVGDSVGCLLGSRVGV